MEQKLNVWILLEAHKKLTFAMKDYDLWKMKYENE